MATPTRIALGALGLELARRYYLLYHGVTTKGFRFVDGESAVGIARRMLIDLMTEILVLVGEGVIASSHTGVVRRVLQARLDKRAIHDLRYGDRFVVRARGWAGAPR